MMGKVIKTKEVVKDIKLKETQIGTKVKDVGLKTKDKVAENIGSLDGVNQQEYSADKLETMERSVVDSVVTVSEKTAKRAVKATTDKIKEKKAKKDISEDVPNDIEEPTIQAETQIEVADKPKKLEAPKTETQVKSNERKKVTTKGVTDDANGEVDLTATDKTSLSSKSKEQKIKAPKGADSIADGGVDLSDKAQNKKSLKEKQIIDDKKKPRKRQQTPPKTKEKPALKKANENRTVKKPTALNGKIKQTGRNADRSVKTIKTADKALKTAEKTAKAAKSTAKTTAETAKRTKQAAKVTTKATVKTVKVVGKALVEMGKAVVAGAKSLIAAAAAGSVPALVIIIVICLVGAIGGTSFGIFLANDETTGTEKTMSQAVSQLTSEHYSNLMALRSEHDYDIYEVEGNTSINWKDVIAVYAVKTTSMENPLEVVTLNDEKIALLSEVMSDMNKMTGAVIPKVVAETTVTTDEDGHSIKTTTYVTKQVLTVTIVQLNARQMAELYRMTDEQKAMIDELMSEEYDALWSDLISAGGGVIINPNTSYVGTGILAWPLDGDYTITSPFGTRIDPISGVIKTHGGTDIAAPTGTPLLAAADGTVITASYDADGYGFYVKIKHDDTYTTLYGHCSVLHVTVGQVVKQGQLIAEVGSTGYSTGPHVHYEVIQNGVRVDAMWFYKQ